MTNIRHRRAPSSSAGFSLIEVMVATLIMLIIVMMVGELFRQSSSAWDTGYARAEGGMVVRTVVGSIQREFSTAIDGRAFGIFSASEGPVKVSNSEISFVCMKDAPRDSGGVTGREPTLVTYTWAGQKMKRVAVRLKRQGGTWGLDSASQDESTIYSGGGPSATYTANFIFTKKAYSTVDNNAVNENFDGLRSAEVGTDLEDAFWTIPRVSIAVELTRTSALSGLEVRSLGPDGIDGSDDDIIVR